MVTLEYRQLRLVQQLGSQPWQVSLGHTEFFSFVVCSGPT